MKESVSRDTIYEFVCESPGMNTYVIAKKLNMSGGKVRYTLSRLEKMGLIEFKFIRRSRKEKLTYPVAALKLLPKGLKSKLNKMKPLFK